ETSHTPADGRQKVVVEATASAGHGALEPVQVSCTSQTPAAGRQMKFDGRKTSAGQLAFAPVHVSEMSHGPAAGRQVSPAPRNSHRLLQHVVAEPFPDPRSHCSIPSTIPSPHTDHAGRADANVTAANSATPQVIFVMKNPFCVVLKGSATT